MATKLFNSFKKFLLFIIEIEKLSKIMYFIYFSSLYIFFKKHFLSTGEIKIAVIINYYLVDFRFIF